MSKNATAPVGLHRLTLKFGIATFGIATLSMLTANLVPVMIIALEATGFSLSAAGILMTASLLATAFSCIVTSRLSLGAKRRPVAALGLLIGGLGFLLVALNPVSWLVGFGLIVGGIGTGAASGAALAALRDLERAAGLSSLTNRILAAAILAVIPLVGIQMLTAFGFLSALCFLGIFAACWLPVARIETAGDHLTRRG
ncbi:hypothetical protein [Renibacterium salmoninarum]|nr:hypothetical protein [Renibacterium salmoninarum]